jgi:glutamine synthetase type III
MVGDCEAVLISEPDVNHFDDGGVITNVDATGYTLYWLSDGIAYKLSARHHNGFTPDIMIKIAESVH